jgi:hypothetical protein
VRSKETKKRLELNGTHQLPVCDDYVNLLGENINILKKSIEALLDVRKGVGLEVNGEKTKGMFMSHYQATGKYHCIKGS